MNEARETKNLLLRLLLRDGSSAERAARELSERGLWRQTVELSAAWRVTPQLRRRLGLFHLPIDTEAKQQLKELSVAAAAQTMFLTRSGAAAVVELNRSGVPAVAFKGLGLIGNLYIGPAERMVHDCDLLVTEESVPRACGVLKELGFLPYVPVHLEKWRHYIDNRVNRMHDYVVLSNEDSVEIDLHWRLGNGMSESLKVEEIFERSEVAPLYGMPVRVAAPADSMVLTAHHALRMAFSPVTTVKDLCDLLRWWEIQPERWVVSEVIERARFWGLSKSLLTLWTILAELTSSPAIALGVRELARSMSEEERRATDRFAHFFWIQVEEGPISDVLMALSVATPSQFRRFLSKRLGILGSAPFRRLRGYGKGPAIPLRVQVGKLLRQCVRLDRQKLAALRAVGKERRLFDSSYESRGRR